MDKATRETLASDPRTIEGNVYTQIQNAVRATQEIVEGVRVMGPAGLEDISYPPVALHEILTNAVLHRDYSIADDIHIRVFDNRVEVESPGRLPGHVTEQNILDERFARNGSIVRLINKFPDPPNKDVGEGLNTAFDAMRNAQLKAPQIRQLQNSVLVTIRHERLASAEELILAHLRQNPTITNGIARQLTNIGADYKIRAIFIRLEKAGQIERVPGRERSRTTWRLKRRNGKSADRGNSST
jgi:ATP-dependent DNA helicase RecG